MINLEKSWKRNAFGSLDLKNTEGIGKSAKTDDRNVLYIWKNERICQGSASECILVSLLAARFEMIKLLKQRYPFVEEGVLLSKLIAYCSKEAHSSVEKACMIGFVKLRILETDSKFSLRGSTLRNAIHEDRSMGLIPFFVSKALPLFFSQLTRWSCCSRWWLSWMCEWNETFLTTPRLIQYAKRQVAQWFHKLYPHFRPIDHSRNS